jgi:hypothetical protein
MPPMASNARFHISIGRDSSGAAFLTCTSRPRTTRTNRAWRAQLRSSTISGSSSPARARSRAKWSRSSASATARASSSCSLPSRVSERPARTQRVKPRSRASATDESAAASMAAAPGSSTAGSGLLGACGSARRSRRVMSRSAGAVDVELARVHPFDEAGDRGGVRGRHAVAQHLHGPEGAEVVVALVVEGVVQRRGGVGHLRVQALGRV